MNNIIDYTIEKLEVWMLENDESKFRNSIEIEQFFDVYKSREDPGNPSVLMLQTVLYSLNWTD